MCAILPRVIRPGSVSARRRNSFWYAGLNIDDGDAGDDEDIALLNGWRHPARKASDSTQRNVKDKKRLTLRSDKDMLKLHQMRTAAVDRPSCAPHSRRGWVNALKPTTNDKEISECLKGNIKKKA